MEPGKLMPLGAQSIAKTTLEQTGALVVGLGSIGRRHLANLAALGITRLGVFRSGKGTGQSENEQLCGAQIYHSYAKALSDGYGLVVVANPTHLHLECTLKAITAGCHVYLEKPVSHNLAGIDTLLKAQQKSGAKLQLGCQLRFHPVISKAKEWLGQGLIGQPLMAFVQAGKYLPDWHPEENYRKSYAARRDMGGGVVLTLIHEIDYVQWLLGPCQVSCAHGGICGVLELDVEDHVLALLRSQDGCIISLGLDYLQRPLSRSFKLVGAQGAITADLAANQAQLVVDGQCQERFALLADWDPNQPYLDCMQNLLNAVEEGREPLVPLPQGVEALKTAVKINDLVAKAS
jgi:predicted dehydrogenase